MTARAATAKPPLGHHCEPRGRRARLAALVIAGVVLLLTGLGCLGWLGYEYLGGNLVAQRAFLQQNEELRERWAAGPPVRPDAHPGGQPRGRAPAAIPGEAIALLRIPAFGPSFEVPILAGTDRAVLSRGVGHYTNTALPGQAGNFALAGHRVTHGQPFARLLELDRGDEVTVETRDATYTYVLDQGPRDLTVPDSAGWVLDPVPGKGWVAPARPLLTLTTCQDLFRSPDRSVGFGHLARVQRKQ